MFDALRRAETERRRREAGRSATEAVSETGRPTIEPPTAAAEQPAPNSVPRQPELVQPGGLPDGFMRELGMLRNSIESTLKKPRRTILFTSSNHGEGTTTIATNLARLHSMQSNERVLLIETNGRSPSLMWKYGLKSNLGLTHYFGRTAPFGSIAQKTQDGLFDVIHVGEADPSKLQLHLEQQLPKLIQEASHAYDTILIDAPPVIGSPETAPMTSMVDGVVLVVRSGKTKREIIQRTLEMIDQFDGTVLGLVLNRKKYYIPAAVYRRI